MVFNIPTRMKRSPLTWRSPKRSWSRRLDARTCQALYHVRMTPERAQLNTCLTVAIEAARRGAGELERWRAKFSVKEKSRADLVTDADHASQKIVKEALLAAFPEHI